jgi:UDP-2,4-diacetamido-2,4,6-trideoxy-beta-L-altropyranose hydrolase
VTPRENEVVVVRPDVGSDVGLGHLRRCLTIASALRGEGLRSVFLLPPGAGAELARAESFAVEVLDAERGGAEDIAVTVDAVERLRAGTVLVDSYAVDAAYLERLRRAGPRVVVLDDLCRWPFPCHLVVNSGLGAESLPYVSSSGDTEFLLGVAYAPLRPEIGGGVRLDGTRERPRILVVFGGADLAGLTPAAVRALEHVPGLLDVVAVVGPFATNGAEVESAALASRHEVDVRHSPERFHELILGSDAALTAGGGTLVELVAAGTPAIAVEIAANQRRGIEALAAAGAAVSAGHADEPGLERRLCRLMTELLADPERRRALGEAGRALIDGRGVERIAARIAALARSRHG